MKQVAEIKSSAEAPIEGLDSVVLLAFSHGCNAFNNSKHLPEFGNAVNSRIVKVKADLHQLGEAYGEEKW